MFGEDFSGYDPEAAQPEKAEVFKSADVTKATKGKIANKATGLTYQFQIMESIGGCTARSALSRACAPC